jgi:hypothetical protein
MGAARRQPSAVYGLRVATIDVPLSDVQRAVAVDVALALGDEDWTPLRLQLATAARATKFGCHHRC